MQTNNEDTTDVNIDDNLNTDGTGDNDTGNNDNNNDTDWKAKYDEVNGRFRRLEKKLEKLKDSPITTQESKQQNQTLDKMDRAILRMEKISSPDEVKLVEDIIKDTGKSLEQVLESKFFQSELKELRENKATEEATPTGSKRSGQSARDTVDYWIAKGELPPWSERELRIKVVNAKIQKQQSKNMFSDNPVIS